MQKFALLLLIVMNFGIFMRYLALLKKQENYLKILKKHYCKRIYQSLNYLTNIDYYYTQKEYVNETTILLRQKDYE